MSPAESARGNGRDRTSAPGEMTSATAEHRTVARVMSLLELVMSSEPDGMRLADLSAAIAAPKSSVHGLAKGLAATGYFREDHNRYYIGPAISSLLANGPIGLPSSYHFALEQLAGKWGETAVLATLVGESTVYLDSVEPAALIRAAPPLHQRLPLWPRSSGKCFLAFMETKRFETYLRRHHPDLAESDRVREELDQVRNERVARNIGETISEHVGVASPIMHGEGAVTHAVVVVGPKSRLGDHVEDLAQDVREAAESLSRSTRER